MKKFKRTRSRQRKFRRRYYRSGRRTGNQKNRKAEQSAADEEIEKLKAENRQLKKNFCVPMLMPKTPKALRTRD